MKKSLFGASTHPAPRLARACAFALPVFCSAVHAEPLAQLSGVVVTATRMESRADDALSDLVVIDSTTLEKYAGRTLGEILTREAGLQMANNGGNGKPTSVFTRGSESRHTLLLIDGVRSGSVTTGQANFDNIPLAAIERIEVVKGPGSALYGADALGGVVQIITKRGVQGLLPSASVTIGDRGYGQTTAALRGGNDTVDFNVAGQYTYDGGINSTLPTNFSFNPDADPFRQSGLNASVHWRFTPGWDAYAQALQSNAQSYLDSFGRQNPSNILRTDNYALGVKGKINERWTTKVQIGQSEDRLRALDQAGAARLNTKQTQIAWENEVKVLSGVALLGLETVNQKVDSDTAFAIKERDIRSAFVGWNGGFEKHSFQAQLRRDENSQFGNTNTGLLAYGFQVLPELRVKASYGTSFVAPSFNLMYFPGFSNPNLIPERGRNKEIGVDWDFAAHQQIKAVVFSNRIRNLITSPAPAFLPVQTNSAKLEGVTVSYKGDFGPWSVRAAADYLNPVDESTQLRLIRRANDQYTGSVDYNTSKWSAGAGVVAVGQRYENAATLQSLSPYTVLDVHARYVIDKQWSVHARLNNAGDVHYETARTFTQPGRTLLLTVNWQGM